MSKYPVTIDTAQRALLWLDASDTDVWVKSGMALKSEYGDSGFTLWDEWSAGAANYDAAACKTRWKSFKAGGRVGIGSLIHAAKQAGFDPKAQAVNAPHEQLTPEARAQREAERKAQAEREAAAIERGQKQAQTQAQKIWGKAIEHAPHLYLGRKLVKAHGVRFEAVGAAFNLLVPLRNADGTLWNLQRIQPDGTKLFLKNGRKSGLWHLIHTPIDNPTEGNSEPVAGVLLVAEGYATAASLHEVTGYPVAVAFDAGNLKPVCLALRSRYPDARILICADNDSQTHAKTGHNTGVESAHKAAGLVGAMVCVPDGLEATESDFNDLAVRLGVDVVKAQIEACLTAFVPVSALSPSADDAHTATESAHTEPLQSEPSEPSAQAAANTARGKNGRFERSVDTGFFLTDDGLFYCSFVKNGDAWQKRDERIGSPIRIVATVYTRTHELDDRSGFGFLVEIKQSDDLWVRRVVLLADVNSGEGFIKHLSDYDFRLGVGSSARNKLRDFFNQAVSFERFNLIGKTGWFNGAFVLPDVTFGDAVTLNKSSGEHENERLMYYSEQSNHRLYASAGMLSDWRERVAMPCARNSRPVLSISCAFAGTLLGLTGIQSGGFHWVGDSSIGKSTLMYLAASVYGSHKFMKTWYNTSTALEATASQYNDTVLLLDEIGQADVKSIGEVMYMFGNEAGKGRGHRTGGLRPSDGWRLMLLSSGEKDFDQVLREGGQKLKAGQDVRFVSLDAAASDGSVFERYDKNNGGADFSDALKSATRECYGTAGLAFIEYVQANHKALRDSLKRDVVTLVNSWIPSHASGQVRRVAERFALVAVAGELASTAGITGWVKDEAEIAAKICFDEWVEARGGLGSSEDAQILAQVRAWFEQNQEARFQSWRRADDDHAQRTAKMAGYVRVLDANGADVDYQETPHDEWQQDPSQPKWTKTKGEDRRWYVFAEAFKSEICADFNHRAVCRLLVEKGILIPESSKSFTRSERLPMMGGKKTRCYVISSQVFC